MKPAQNQTTKVNYTPFEASYYFYSLYHVQGSEKAKARSRRQLIFAVGLFAVVAVVLSLRSGMTPAMYAGFTAGLLFFGLFPALTRRLIKRSIKKALSSENGAALLSPVSLHAAETTLNVSQGEDNWEIHGSGIIDLAWFKGFLLITPDEGAGFAIPAEAFGSTEEAHAFEAEIRRLMALEAPEPAEESEEEPEPEDQ